MPLLTITALFLTAAVSLILASAGKPLFVPLALAAATTSLLTGVELERRRGQK